MSAATGPADLLASDESPPFEIAARGDGSSPFVIICDHAGRELPRALGSLGLSSADLASHIAWDIGAAAVARYMGRTLGAFVILQRYSRLVIDCNRWPTAPDSIATQSGGISIPGNRDLTQTDATERLRVVFDPYHEQIRRELDRRAQASQTSILVALHSFTPVMQGERRPWHMGVLYHRDARLSGRLLQLLRRDSALVVGDNEPYSGRDGRDYSIIEHGEGRRLPYVELEIRQDLIAEPQAQERWAARLGELLTDASEVFRE